MVLYPYFFSAIYLGFAHSLESDHLAAIFNLISDKQKTKKIFLQGFFWGVGHFVSILFIGLLMQGLKVFISEVFFSKLEGMVGVMLLSIGVYKLYALSKKSNPQIKHTKSLAFGIGIVHGLAGSGTLLSLSLYVAGSIYDSFVFLLLFGISSILGMAVTMFTLSNFLHFFSKYIHQVAQLFSIGTAIICLCLGSLLFYEHFF